MNAEVERGDWKTLLGMRWKADNQLCAQRSEQDFFHYG
jgi:hypothetical protein